MQTLILIVIAILIVHYLLKDLEVQVSSIAQNRIEKFNAGYHPHLDYDYAVAMRSFGRTSYLNEAINNAYCNPHGEYYTMRYNAPSEFVARKIVRTCPLELGYYNSCGSRIFN